MNNNMTDIAQFVLLKISKFRFIKIYSNIFVFEYVIKYLLQN